MSARFLGILRLAIKATLTRAIDTACKSPQLFPLLPNALKADAVHAGIESTITASKLFVTEEQC